MAGIGANIRAILSVFIAMTLYACVSYKSLSQEAATSISSSIKTGDMLKVVLKNGEKINYLKVSSVNEENIAGTRLFLKHNHWRQESATIKISEIQTIKKRKFSTGKTIVLGVGLIPVGLLIYFLLNPPVFRMTL
jgi:hypothetical protein